MAQRCIVRAALLMATLAGAAPAAADLFRCTQPDGSVAFTDREEACRDAVSHEPSRSLQEVDPVPAAKALTPAKIGARTPEGTAREGVWREKKLKAEQELAALTKKRDYLERYITHCNRHRKILEQDQSGLYTEISCKNIREKYVEVTKDEAEVSAYLEATLEQECRRAGCLPGWIR